MSQLDALRLSENLRQRMVDFALDDSFVRDSKLSEICRSIWGGPPSEGGLISDLWVEGAFPSKSSPHGLDSLVAEGKFDSRLRDILNKPESMPRVCRQNNLVHSTRARIWQTARKESPRLA